MAMWQHTLVCMYGVVCGDVSWTDFNEETTSSLRMIWIEIETRWSVLSILILTL